MSSDYYMVITIFLVSPRHSHANELTFIDVHGIYQMMPPNVWPSGRIQLYSLQPSINLPSYSAAMIPMYYEGGMKARVRHVKSIELHRLLALTRDSNQGPTVQGSNYYITAAGNSYGSETRLQEYLVIFTRIWQINQTVRLLRLWAEVLWFKYFIPRALMCDKPIVCIGAATAQLARDRTLPIFGNSKCDPPTIVLSIINIHYNLDPTTYSTTAAPLYVCTITYNNNFIVWRNIRAEIEVLGYHQPCVNEISRLSKHEILWQLVIKSTMWLYKFSSNKTPAQVRI